MVIELKEPGKEPRKDMNAKGRMMCPVCNVSLSMADRQGRDGGGGARSLIRLFR